MTEQIDARRFAAVEARHEIENLITRYCMACDDRDIAGLINLFTEDAYFGEHNGSGAQGRPAVFENYRRSLGAMGPTYHWSHDRLIELEPGSIERATGIIMAHCEISIDNIGYVAGMRYYDQYRKVDGAWKFARRAFKFLYLMPANRADEALTARQRVWRGGMWRDADLPEPLDTWKTWRDVTLPPL